MIAGANMAATKVFARVLFMIFIVGSVDFKKFNRFENILSSSLSHIAKWGNHNMLDTDYLGAYSTRFTLAHRCTKRMRICKEINMWNKHGYTLLAPTEVDVCMDVERNPGPDLDDVISVRNKAKQITRYSQYELIST